VEIGLEKSEKSDLEHNALITKKKFFNLLR